MPSERNKSLSVILDAAKKASKLPRYSSLLEFFEQGFTLTEDDRFKKFDLRFSPWIRVLCNWFDDPNVDWIYLSMGSQVAKTTFMMGTLLYVSQYVRGAVPCMWVQAVEELAKIFISKRLKPFLDNSGSEALSSGKWKNEAFRVYNAAVKVGISTSEATLRTHPARYVFGDEYSIWEQTIQYVMQRTRTFEGCRKGIFGSTPPRDPNHHCVQQIRSGNWWQWWVPCPACSVYQPMLFANLKWYQKKHEDENWDYEKVKETARYKCRECGELWSEQQKLEIINLGKAVCVDCETYEQVSPKVCDSNTLQINALYSVFTSFGQLAKNFLTAKAAGSEALKTFFTDELAEIPEAVGTESLKELELGKYQHPTRRSGYQDGFALYTVGVDVQRTGKLYYVIQGWQSGGIVSGHTLKHGTVSWRDGNGLPSWKSLMAELAPWQHCLYAVGIDSTDGVVAQDVFDFCYWSGKLYVPIKDTGSGQLLKVTRRSSADFRGRENSQRQVSVLVINSSMIKDDIAAAFLRAPGEPGAWSFPSDCDETFLRHLANEKRATIKQNGRVVTKWIPRYSGAPQHYFSALVYATAVMEEQRYRIQTTKAQESNDQIQFRRIRSNGVNVWR